MFILSLLNVIVRRLPDLTPFIGSQIDGCVTLLIIVKSTVVIPCL